MTVTEFDTSARQLVERIDGADVDRSRVADQHKRSVSRVAIFAHRARKRTGIDTMQ